MDEAFPSLTRRNLRDRHRPIRAADAVCTIRHRRPASTRTFHSADLRLRCAGDDDRRTLGPSRHRPSSPGRPRLGGMEQPPASIPFHRSRCRAIVAQSRGRRRGTPEDQQHRSRRNIGRRRYLREPARIGIRLPHHLGWHRQFRDAVPHQRLLHRRRDTLGSRRVPGCQRSSPGGRPRKNSLFSLLGSRPATGQRHRNVRLGRSFGTSHRDHCQLAGC